MTVTPRRIRVLPGPPESDPPAVAPSGDDAPPPPVRDPMVTGALLAALALVAAVAVVLAVDASRPWLLAALVAAVASAGFAWHRVVAHHRTTVADVVVANERRDLAARRTREFVTIASHELRTPVAIIAGYAETIPELWDELSPVERREHADRLVRASRRLGDLVDAMLTQALADEGELPLTLTDVDVGDAIREAIELSLFHPKDVNVRCEPGLQARADAPYLVRILTSLLQNAAMYGDGPVEVSATRTADRVCVAIRDHGAGVDPDFVPHLFERFSRVNTDRSGGAPDGAGLGLSIAAGIAEQMEGALSYQPASPGARFVLCVPAA